MSEETIEAGLYKICLACTSTPVEGCESMTEEQVNEWMNANQENYEVENEYADTVKYIRMPV